MAACTRDCMCIRYRRAPVGLNVKMQIYLYVLRGGLFPSPGCLGYRSVTSPPPPALPFNNAPRRPRTQKPDCQTLSSNMFLPGGLSYYSHSHVNRRILVCKTKDE